MTSAEMSQNIETHRTSKTFDLAVIGAGSAGFAAAIGAAELGASVALIGHGTIGLEIMDDQSDVDSVFVPVGGGTLIVGVASAIRSLNSSVRIIAVEPEGCATLTASLKQDKPATVDCKTSCDGVAIPYMTEEMFPILKDIIADVITVSEEAIQRAMRALALGNRIIVEPAAALSVAAAMATPAKKRGQTVCLVTGGSIETDQLLATLA